MSITIYFFYIIRNNVIVKYHSYICISYVYAPIVNLRWNFKYKIIPSELVCMLIMHIKSNLKIYFE